MKGISIRQPWASLIRHGYKTIETRTYNISHRGEVLICSSQKPFDRWNDIKCTSSFDNYYKEMLNKETDPIIYGHAIAIATIINSRDMRSSDEEFALCKYSEDQYNSKAIKAWIMNDIRPIEPIPIKGNVFPFNINKKIIKQISVVSL